MNDISIEAVNIISSPDIKWLLVSFESDAVLDLSANHNVWTIHEILYNILQVNVKGL